MENGGKHNWLFAQAPERISITGAIDNCVANNERQHNDRNHGDRSNEANSPGEASKRLNTRDDQDHKTDAAEEQPTKEGEGDKPHILEDVQTFSPVDVGVSDVIGHVVGNARKISLVLLSRSQKVHALHIERTEFGLRHVANLGGVGQSISCPHTGID